MQQLGFVVVELRMVKKIIQIGDSVLLSRSKDVDITKGISRETKQTARDLIDTCMSDLQSSAGLSAVQIGILERIFVARKPNEQGGFDFDSIEWDVFINPTIEIIDSSVNTEWEGCLSVGKGGERLFAPVSRPNKVKVTYTDLDNNKKSVIASGYYAHILQHEMDHLNGVLFLKHVTNPENIWKEEALDKYINRFGHYPEVV